MRLVSLKIDSDVSGDKVMKKSPKMVAILDVILAINSNYNTYSYRNP